MKRMQRRGAQSRVNSNNYLHRLARVTKTGRGMKGPWGLASAADLFLSSDRPHLTNPRFFGRPVTGPTRLIARNVNDEEPVCWAQRLNQKIVDGGKRIGRCQNPRALSNGANGAEPGYGLRKNLRRSQPQLCDDDVARWLRRQRLNRQ